MKSKHINKTKVMSNGRNIPQPKGGGRRSYLQSKRRMKTRSELKIVWNFFKRIPTYILWQTQITRIYDYFPELISFKISIVH